MVASKSLNIIFKATDRVSAVIDKMNRGINSNIVAMNRMNRSYNYFKSAMGKSNIFSTLSTDVASLRDKITLGIRPWHLWAGAIGVAYGAFRLFKKAIEEGAKRDAIKAGFMPLAGGDTNKASQLASRVQEVSIQTTFKSTDIADNVKSLAIAMRGDMERAFQTFSLLANTSGGDLDKLNRQVNGYTKAIFKQKVTLESLNIIAESNVPIFDEMAYVMYKNRDATGQLMKEISKGKVPLEVMYQAIENLNIKGALFYNAQAYKAKSAIGQYEQLSETINLAFGELGTVFLEALQPIMPVLFEAVQGFREFIYANKELIKTKFTAFVDKMIVGLKAIFQYFSENKTQILNKILSIFDAIGDTIMFIVEHREGIATIVSLWVKLAVALYVIAPVLKTISVLYNLIIWTMITFEISALAASGYIGLILIALAAVAWVGYTIYKNWDKIKENLFVIGATVAMLFSPALAPLALLGIIIHEIWQNWDLIATSFREGGILAGFLKIGEVIVSAVLLPIQKVLTMLYEMTGFNFIKNARDAIYQTRMDLLSTEPTRNYVQIPTAAQQSMNHKLSVTMFGQDPYQLEVNKEGTSKGLQVKTTKTR